MKKQLLTTILTVCLLWAVCAGSALAANIKIMLNGQALSFEQAPYTNNGVTMVPMRVIFEALGADVDYDAASNKITAGRGDVTIELVLGQKTAKKNGASLTLDSAAVTKNGSAMVPLRFVAEALGADVDWDDASQTVNINLSGPSKQAQLAAATNLALEVGPRTAPVLNSFGSYMEDFIFVMQSSVFKYQYIDKGKQQGESRMVEPVMPPGPFVDDITPKFTVEYYEQVIRELAEERPYFEIYRYDKYVTVSPGRYHREDRYGITYKPYADKDYECSVEFNDTARGLTLTLYYEGGFGDAEAIINAFYMPFVEKMTNEDVIKNLTTDCWQKYIDEKSGLHYYLAYNYNGSGSVSFFNRDGEINDQIELRMNDIEHPDLFMNGWSTLNDPQGVADCIDYLKATNMYCRFGLCLRFYEDN